MPAITSPTHLFDDVRCVTQTGIARIGAWRRRRKIIRDTVEELSRLSDRELADLGFFRADIRAIARQAAQEA